MIYSATDYLIFAAFISILDYWCKDEDETNLNFLTSTLGIVIFIHIPLLICFFIV